MNSRLRVIMLGAGYLTQRNTRHPREQPGEPDGTDVVTIFR
jgi:hypothetical protein